jgi:hypothetical protein
VQTSVRSPPTEPGTVLRVKKSRPCRLPIHHFRGRELPAIPYSTQESFDSLAAVACLDDRARRPSSRCTSPNDVASILGCRDSASVHYEGARCYRADKSINLWDPWATCAAAVADNRSRFVEKDVGRKQQSPKITTLAWQYASQADRSGFGLGNAVVSPRRNESVVG